jgi:hypothetical protein
VAGIVIGSLAAVALLGGVLFYCGVRRGVHQERHGGEELVDPATSYKKSGGGAAGDAKTVDYQPLGAKADGREDSQVRPPPGTAALLGRDQYDTGVAVDGPGSINAVAVAEAPVVSSAAEPSAAPASASGASPAAEEPVDVSGPSAVHQAMDEKNSDRAALLSGWQPSISLSISPV